MTETGIVTSVDPATHTVTIQFNAHGTCKSCGMCLIGNGNDHSQMQLTAKNTVDATLGDTVEFEVKPGAMLRASMLIYGFPLAMLLTGFVLGKMLSQLLRAAEDLLSICGAALFFYFAFYILHLRNKPAIGQTSDHITILRKDQSALSAAAQDN